MALIFSVNPYLWAISCRNSRYDRGIARIAKAPTPVISVGNITTGGAGKTPFARMISAFYRNNGIKPAVISRGYGRETRGIVVAGDGQKICAAHYESGDELALHAADGIAIAAENRLKGCLKARDLGAKICILDDGFQHRKLRRNIDIVLLDNQTINDRLLPFGNLREPISALRRAHIIAAQEQISDANLKSLPINPNSLIIRFTVKTEAPYLLNKTSLSDYKYPETMIALCGIAKPERFFNSAAKYFNLSNRVALRDHVKYTAKVVDKILKKSIESNAEGIVTTEKDAVKLRDYETVFSKENIKVYVLPVETEITDGGDDFYETIRAAARMYDAY